MAETNNQEITNNSDVNIEQQNDDHSTIIESKKDIVEEFEDIKIDDKETTNEGDKNTTTTSNGAPTETTLIKCSAVHALERAMPDYDYSHLIKELRVKILQECESNPGIYSQIDIDKCHQDDWYLARFLLRNKMNVDYSFEMLKKTMRFIHESMVNTLKAEDFPAEFYKLGGLFSHGQDRKGNKVLYMRVRLHKKMPEIQMYVESFLFHKINKVDAEANGKGKFINSYIIIVLFLVSLCVFLVQDNNNNNQ